MINIPQVVLNEIAERHGLAVPVFGYICRMKREADGKMSMVKLAQGQSGSTESLVQLAWLRATFLYWERASIRNFMAGGRPELRELLPHVESPEEAAALAAREWGLNVTQAALLCERVRVCPRLPSVESYPMALREPVFPLVPGYLKRYAAGKPLAPLPAAQDLRDKEACRVLLERYLASGRPLSDSSLMAFLYKDVFGRASQE